MFSVRHQPPKGFAKPMPFNEIFKVQKKTNIRSLIESLSNEGENPTATNIFNYNYLSERKEVLGDAFDDLFSDKINIFAHLKLIDFSASSKKENFNYKNIVCELRNLYEHGLQANMDLAPPLDLRFSTKNVARAISNTEVQTDNDLLYLVQQKPALNNVVESNTVPKEHSFADSNLEGQNGNYSRKCCCQNSRMFVRHLTNNLVLDYLTSNEQSNEGVIFKNIYLICKHPADKAVSSETNINANNCNSSVHSGIITQNVNSYLSKNSIDTTVSSSTNPLCEKINKSNKKSLKTPCGSEKTINDILDDIDRNRRIKIKIGRKRQLRRYFMKLCNLSKNINRSPPAKKASGREKLKLYTHLKQPKTSVVKHSIKESQQYKQIPEKAQSSTTEKIIKPINKQTKTTSVTQVNNGNNSLSGEFATTDLDEERQKKIMLRALDLISIDEKLLYAQKQKFLKKNKVITQSPVYVEEESSSDEFDKFFKRKRRPSENSFKRERLFLQPKKYLLRKVDLTEEGDIDRDTEYQKLIEGSSLCSKVPVIKSNPRYGANRIFLDTYPKYKDNATFCQKTTESCAPAHQENISIKWKTKTYDLNNNMSPYKRPKKNKRFRKTMKRTSSRKALKMRIFKENNTHKVEML